LRSLAFTRSDESDEIAIMDLDTFFALAMRESNGRAFDASCGVLRGA
jgi:hypothetical protein